MIDREEVYTMLMLRNRENTIFSTLSRGLIQKINGHVEDLSSEITKALGLAARGKKEDVKDLLVMLDKNPSLLLLRGNVKTPGGDKHIGVTLYEFLLGDGDDELAKTVQGYFSKIKNGEQESICQSNRYREHIEGMLTQEPYDLTPLIEIIKKASASDVKAVLNKDMTGKSELCSAIFQFRKDWAPRVFLEPCMHYNYASLQHAFDILDREWNNLYKTSGNNYDKLNLVWRQLIGFEMRRLPGIDRCIMAQGLYYVVEKEEKMERTDKFKNSNGNFDGVLEVDTEEGLGWDFAVDITGRVRLEPMCNCRVRHTALVALENLCQTKNFKLTELMQPQSARQLTECVMV